MSYQEYSIDGIGFCTYGLSTTSSKLKELISLTNDFKEEIWEDVKDFTSPLEFYDYGEEYCDDCGCTALGFYFMRVFNELENIQVTCCMDFDGDEYVMYLPRMPWGLSEEEKNLTKDSLVSLFHKYTSILFEDEISIDWVSCHNGG